MYFPEIIAFFCPPTDTRSLESIQEKSRRQFEVDVRTMAERVAGKEPRWELKPFNYCLIDGVCQICRGTHPEHKKYCTMWKKTRLVYNILSKCPECFTTNKVHYPECSEYHTFWIGDIPLMNQDQLETAIEHYQHRKNMAERRKARPGVLWGEKDERDLTAIQLILDDLSSALEKH